MRLWELNAEHPSHARRTSRRRCENDTARRPIFSTDTGVLGALLLRALPVSNMSGTNGRLPALCLCEGYRTAHPRRLSDLGRTSPRTRCNNRCRSLASGSHYIYGRERERMEFCRLIIPAVVKVACGWRMRARSPILHLIYRPEVWCSSIPSVHLVGSLEEVFPLPIDRYTL